VSLETLNIAMQPTTAAIGELYGAHQGWLHAWLRRRTGCSATAADLAQDTFLRLLHRPQKTANVRSPRALLTTVARGLLVNHWRRLEVERAYLEVLAEKPEALATSPEEREETLEALDAVVAILDGLRPRTREIFLLSQMDGLTYPQIAARFDITVNAVQKAMSRALAHCYHAVYAA